MSELLASALSELSDPHYDDGDPGQEATRRLIHDYVETHRVDALFRSPLSRHVTASCFVFNEDRSQILLSLHRKGRFWVQFGGHLEAGDGTLNGAALRELREESGVDVAALDTTGIVEFDVHDLSGAFGSCRTHLDVGFVATVPLDARLGISPESDDLGWWPVTALPTNAAWGLGRRIARALAVVGGRVP